MSRFYVYEDQGIDGTWYVTIKKDERTLDTGKGDTLEAARKDAVVSLSIPDRIEFEAWYHRREIVKKVIAVLIAASIPVLCMFYLAFEYLQRTP